MAWLRRGLVVGSEGSADGLAGSDGLPAAENGNLLAVEKPD
jgi:hypothetical protein